MKKLLFLLSLFILVGAVPAEAKKKNQQAQKAQAAKEKEKKAEKEKRDRINNAIDAFLEDHDKNKDKSVTLEEYVTGESDAKSAEENFQRYNKNKDRYLSKTEIQELLGL